MSDRDTVYLSNWSSHKTPGHHGPGRKWTIMALPKRPHEHGDGAVTSLTPPTADLSLARAGQITTGEYRRRCELWWQIHDLRPSILAARMRDGRITDVRDGDTLCCACSRDKAAAGQCHRVWAAEALAAAGWRVILDGKELSS